MFVSTAPGFEGTPVTRRLLYFTVLLPVFIGLLEYQYMLDLAVTPHLLEWHQWWRIPLNQLAYVSQSQVLFASLLFYNFRVLERLLGSHKFLSFIVIVFFFSMVLTPITMFILHALPVIRLNYIPAGQTTVLFALLGLFKRLVPVVYRFQLSPIQTSNNDNEFKLQLSDKSFVYLVAVQLALGSMFGSLVSALLGWIIGGMIFSEVLPGKSWRVPFYQYMGLEEKDDNSNASSRGEGDQQQQQQQQQDQEDVTSDTNVQDQQQRQQQDQDDQQGHRPLASQLLDTFRT